MTNKSIFDRWSVIHFCAGVVFCGAMFLFKEWPLWIVLLVGMYAAVIWEYIEAFLEIILRMEVEYKINRFVGDPIALLLGILLGYVVLTL